MPAPSEPSLIPPPKPRSTKPESIDVARYKKNLNALQAVQPSIAQVVEAAPIPNGVVEAVGRDGTRTYQLPGGAGRRVWFGQSSMPSISASEMFAIAGGDGGNVCLPGILTGMEPLVIADRLAEHAAIFVVEENPLDLKLAMHLYDYAALLSGGRLVFILGDDVHARLVDFFREHPGYLLPTQMFTVPQRSPAQNVDLRRQFERAGEAVSIVQAEIIEACAESIRHRTRTAIPPNPRIALLGVEPGDGAIEQTRRIQRALDALGWTYVTCIPDAPNKCHVTARMGAVERVSADLVLFLNGFSTSLRKLLPAELPIASWFLSDAGTPPAPHEMDQQDMLFACSQSQYDSFMSAGATGGAVALLEPAADILACQPSQPNEERRKTIAALMDLPDDRPETCGVTLPSHIALWHALQHATRRHVDRYSDAIADEILQMAEKSSGTELIDPAGREQFRSAIATRIAPAAIGRAAVEELSSRGFEIELWGANWPALESRVDPRHGAIPHGEALVQMLYSVDAVLLPRMTPLAVQLAMDALAAGASVIVGATYESFLREYPGLSSIAESLSFYQTTGELIDAARQLRDDPKRRELAEAAIVEVRTNHSVTQRLITIVDRIRKRVK